MNVLTRRQQLPPPREWTASARDNFYRLFGLRLNLDFLDGDEQRELIALQRPVEEGEDRLLSAKESSKLAKLWRKACPAFVEWEREQDKAELERKLFEVTLPLKRAQRRRWEEPGATLIPPEMFTQWREDFVYAEHVALFALLSTQMENGVPLGYDSTVENPRTEDVTLVVSESAGPVHGARTEDGAMFSRWKQNAKHLAANGWFEVEAGMPYWRIRYGTRMRRFLQGRS